MPRLEFTGRSADQDGPIQLLRMQTAAIRHELGDEHTYEFVQGTIKCPVVPEMKNISHADPTHYSYFDPTGESVLAAIDALDRYVETEGPFDGVIGFSQGASLAVMFMVSYAHLHPNAPLPFTCAIFLSRAATYDPVSWRCNGSIRRLENMPSGHDPIPIPVAAIWGRHDLDYVQEEGHLTPNVFLESLCEKVVHGGGHEVPGHHSKSCLQITMKATRRVCARAQMLA